MVQDDPFAVLGLPALAELTDDDVRAAWRRIAAATHPDREDGGDPARFGAAAAAYALLRTSFGRGEALADLSAGAPRGRSRRGLRARGTRRSWSPAHWHPKRRGAHRLHPAAPPTRSPRHSGDARYRPAGDRGFPPAAVYARFRAAAYARYRRAGYAGIDRGLALPAAGAAVGAAAAIAAVGWTPATIGLVAGALTVTCWGLWRRAWRDR
jgi:curved DNA-binding protein CbpA